MSVYITGQNQWLSATLSGVVDSGRVLIAHWAKRDSGQTLGSTNTPVMLGSDAAGANPSLRTGMTSLGAVRCMPNGSAIDGGTPAADTWFHEAGSFGPWSGATVARRVWLNGTLTTNNTSATSATTMNFLRIGASLTGGLTNWKGRVAHVGIWIGLTTTQEDSLLVELQTKFVDATTIAPNFSWYLANAALTTAATGGVALTNSAATADADEPSGLTGAVVGLAWSSMMVM